MKIVEIVWRDHSTTHGWARTLAKPFTVKSCSYLAEETDDHYVIVESEVQDETGDASRWGCSTCIMKSDVVSFTVVRD